MRLPYCSRSEKRTVRNRPDSSSGAATATVRKIQVFSTDLKRPHGRGCAGEPAPKTSSVSGGKESLVVYPFSPRTGQEDKHEPHRFIQSPDRHSTYSRHVSMPLHSSVHSVSRSRTRRFLVVFPWNTLMKTAATEGVAMVEEISSLPADVQIATRSRRARDVVHRRPIGLMMIVPAVLPSDAIKPAVYDRISPVSRRNFDRESRHRSSYTRSPSLFNPRATNFKRIKDL